MHRLIAIIVLTVMLALQALAPSASQSWRQIRTPRTRYESTSYESDRRRD